MEQIQRFHSDEELQVGLSNSETDFVLSHFHPGAQIEDVRYFDNYDLPCPLKLRIRCSNGTRKDVVMRKARHGSIETEVTAFAILSDADLPVPRMLVPPTELGNQKVMMTSLLEGVNLQKFSMSSVRNLERSKRLLSEAIDELEAATDRLRADPRSSGLTTISLSDQLRMIEESESE